MERTRKVRRTSVVIAAERARTGKMPIAPNFKAATHARFRERRKAIMALVRAKDSAGLREEAKAINPVSTSPRALKRFAENAAAAIDAKAVAAKKKTTAKKPKRPSLRLVKSA